jgi:hypothetical protein
VEHSFDLWVLGHEPDGARPVDQSIASLVRHLSPLRLAPSHEQIG